MSSRRCSRSTGFVGRALCLRRLQLVVAQHGAVQLVGPHVDRRRCGARGSNQGECRPALTLREAHEREDAVRQGHLDVVAFTHADQQGVGFDWLDGEPVGVGDFHPVAADGHTEGGIASGVDHADPDPLSRAALERAVIRRGSPVDQVVGVGHVAGVAAEDRTSGAHQHAARGLRLRCVSRRRRGRGRSAHVHRAVVHAAHVHAAVVHAGPQLLEQGVRGATTDAVEPVVEDDHPLLVVGVAVRRVLHDQGRVQPAVQLEAGVRVEPVGAGDVGAEPVDELPAGRDRLLGHPRDAVHVVTEGKSMPVDAGLDRQPVDHAGLDRVAFSHPEGLSGEGVAVGPGGHLNAAQIDASRPCGQGERTHRPHWAPGLRCLHFRTVRLHQPRRRGGRGRP